MIRIARPIGALAIVLVTCTGGGAGAQDSPTPPTEWARLSARLDAETAKTVHEIVLVTRKSRLPTEPLVATALEGAARRATPERIVKAVRAQAAALETARQSLQPRATEAEIVAGASALRARVPPAFLKQLRALRQGSMVIPLVVTADMVARGVPPDDASDAVAAAVHAGVPDPDLLRLREHVAGDIGSGIAPGEAARGRAHALLLRKDGPARGPIPTR